LTGRGQVKPFAFTDEERNRQIFLELPDARGDIGLDAMQSLGCARHAALANDGAEDQQIG
jgi:hypothetical protein